MMLKTVAMIWLLLVCLGIVGCCIIGIYRMIVAHPKESRITLGMMLVVIVTVTAAIIVTT